MAEETYSDEPTRAAPPQATVPPSTVIVTDRPESGGSAGWFVAFAVLLAVLVAIWAFTGFGQGAKDSDLMKDNALTTAADKVGDAADKVGDAAGKVGDQAADTAHSAAQTADKAADSTVTVTTGSSDDDAGSGD
jgi:hypothetical protein